MSIRPAERAIAPATGSMRILLVEDNKVNQLVALSLLKRLGYMHVDVAANGLAAVDAVAQQPYDLVLMDVQMPEMDGLEATRIICARHPRETRPVIVALTANAMPGDRELCMEAGMDDYIAKPLTPEPLLEVLAGVAARLAS